MQVLNILILVGAIQGLISSVLLFYAKKGSKISNRLLSVLILLISMACLNLYIMQTGIRYRSDVAYVFAYVFPLLIVMPIGPIIYFYIRSLLTTDFKILRNHRIHFIPVVIDLVPYVTGTVFICGLSLNLFDKGNESSWRHFIDQYDIYSDILRWSSMSLYIFFSIRLLNNDRAASNTASSSSWARQFIIVFSAFQLLWLVHLIPYLLPSVRKEFMDLVDWYPIYIPLAILVYWLGINGYIHGFNYDNSSRKNLSTLSPEVIERTHLTLKKAMENDRMFLDPDLNLEKVVKHTGIPQKTISAVLNQNIGKSFNEFINVYRVLELQKRLVEPGNEHLTIIGLALECGFNSQATMQRSFKQLTQYSPREYQTTHKHKLIPQNEVNATQI